MKFWLISFFVFQCMTLTYSQKYDQQPISILDIEKGIVNFEYFRPVLLENGFRFERKDRQSEYWKVLLDGDDLLCQVCIQFSLWTFEGKEMSRTMNFQIRKDLLPDYNKKFLEAIKRSFPNKDAKMMTSTIVTDSSTSKDDYYLVYSRKTDNIVVTLEEDGIWVKYLFEKNLYKK